MPKGVSATRTGLSFGRNKGHKVNTISKKDRRSKPSNRKGRLGKRTKFVREVIREICGFSPYEKRMLELLRTNAPKDAKRAYRFAKVRLGTHSRALRKREELMVVVRHEAMVERAK
jgi:large subunit ribosomal protein L36e